MALSEHELDAIHWLTMRLRLPAEGVAKRFAQAQERRMRFCIARWPQGPCCDRCGAAHPNWIESRSLFQCERCRRQFSLTSGSILHRTRLGLETWFLATEAVIRSRATGGHNSHITAHELAKITGVEYVAAYRMKQIVIADIQRGGPGLLSRAICTEDLRLPIKVIQGSEEHLDWLIKLQFAS